MKNKNPWKLLRCIGIAPWQIFTGEQRFIFGGRDGGPDTPDGGAAGESENAGAEAEDADDAGEAPADTETTIQAGARLVEAGQSRLPESAEPSYENSMQAVERFVNSLTPDQQKDREILNVIDKALDELRRGQWIDSSADRKDILGQMRADVVEIIEAQTPAATSDENAPPPAGEAEEGEEDGAEVLPPAAATEGGAGEAQAAHTEAAPKRPRLGDKERIARAIKIGKVDRDKIVKTLDISDADKTVDAKLVAAVRKFQQELWEAATPEDKAKFKARYKNAKGFGDGIWGEDTQALFDVVAKYADGKDGGFKEKLAKLNPPAAPAAAPAETAKSAPPAAPPAAAETAREATPPKVAQLSNFPEYKAPPPLPEFHEDGFYTIEVPEFFGIDLGTTSEDQLKKWGVEEGAVVYVRNGSPTEGKAITIETAAGKTFNIDGGNLESLGDDDEKRTIYIGQRYELLFGANQRDYLPRVDIKNVRSYRDRLVCIDKDAKSPGPGLVVIKYSDGTIETNGVPQSELDEVDQEDTYAYLVETYDNIDLAMQSNILPADRAAYQEAISRTPVDTQKRKGLAESAPLEVRVTRDCPLFYIDSRGKIWTVTRTNEFVKTGAKVSVLGKTQDGKYLQVATADGFTGFIETSRTDGNIVAKAPVAPPAAPAAVAAAPAAPAATIPPSPPPAEAAPRRPVFPAGAAPPAAPPAPAA